MNALGKTLSTALLTSDELELVRPLLREAGVLLPARDLPFAVCPGKELHTGPSAAKDCAVLKRDVCGILVPFLYCFHQHCREVLRPYNQYLFSASLRGRVVARPCPYRRIIVPDDEVQSAPEEPRVQLDQILAEYPWSYADILNDERGRVTASPWQHYIILLSMFQGDDTLWIGNDILNRASRVTGRISGRLVGGWIAGNAQGCTFVRVFFRRRTAPDPMRMLLARHS